VDLRERLTDDDLARPDYLSASHIHRYVLAAELCRGLRVLDLGCGTGYGCEILAGSAAAVHGVDIDEGAIELARRERKAGALEFSVSDAVACLRVIAGEDVDAVVMYEALEHVPDPEAVLDEFERLAAAGVRLIVSVPNSRAFRERNPFHVTDFGYAEARRALRRFGHDATMLYQVLAEGSLILGDGARPDDFRGRVGALEQAEPEYANDFIALVGFGLDVGERVTAELNLVATPAHNRYMIELERANGELLRANRQLARGMYGKRDAAAAAVIVYYEESQERVRQLERQLAEVEGALHQEWAWRDAARYRAVDKLVAGVKGVPALTVLLRGARRLARLVSRAGRGG
jgi:2-polyprenyl-3-methyl-5-hydroxy-6-metoxy-1,4-benzoquinol methylase